MSDSESPAPPPRREEPSLLPRPSEQRLLFRWFFFGVFAFLLYQLILILSLFSSVIIWACSLSLVFWPLHRRLETYMPGRANLAAGLSTTAVLLLVVMPIIMVFWIVAKQSTQLYPTVQSWLQAFGSADSPSLLDSLPDFISEPLSRFSAWAETIPLFTGLDFEDYLLSMVEGGSAFLASFGAAAARNVLFAVINLALILVLMYFCFRDGARFLGWLLDIVPMESDQATTVALRVYDTVTAVIRAALITAGVQAALALVGYMVAGVPLALLFGVLTGFAALIPLLCAALIWVPIAIFIFTQAPGWGIFLFAWGALVVSMIDNFLKPILIGSQARMPILLIFCSMLGGANIYGVTGFIVGPILMALLLAFISIYRDYYLPKREARAVPDKERSDA